MDLSPFARLPPELRNTIYDFASTTQGGVFIELDRDETKTLQWRLKSQTCHPHPLALTEVSKEVREETLGSFFAVNSVSLIVPMLRTTPAPPTPRPKPITCKIKQWLRTLHPKERCALKCIELDLGTWMPGSPRHYVSEEYLASNLLDIATCFENHSVGAVVWITMSGGQYCGSRDVYPVSFKLSAFDAVALKTLVSTTLQEKMRRYNGSRDHQHSVGGYFIRRYYERLQKLAMSLESLLEQKTVAQDSGLRKRKRRLGE